MAFNDVGRWSEAAVALATAKRLAGELGDLTGYFAAQSNLVSNHLLRWQHRRVLELTEGITMPTPKGDG